MSTGGSGGGGAFPVSTARAHPAHEPVPIGSGVQTTLGWQSAVDDDEGTAMHTMNVSVFVEPGRIVLDERWVPEVGPNDALVRITTTISGTDIHILKREDLVERGRIMGHEPVGVIEELGPGLSGH